MSAPAGSRPRGRAGALGAALALLVILSAIVTLGARAGTTAGPGRAAMSQPAARTDDGALRGTTGGSMDEFLGIPYAAPPVGALRWQPPAPAARWSGTRLATQFGANCAQPASPYGTASSSENCLYLNVYTPRATSAHARLPVMVWLHGGAFDYGESNDFNPAPLVAQGIIVVTVNYRLGALGFLADSSLTSKSGGSGDFGLLDQQAALRWVQANITAFGGDPRAVTLAGESAGGLSVLAQLASPDAAGLFSRAIVESGTYQLDQDTLTQAESSGAAFAAKTGCADNSAACLRALPVAAILAAQDQAGYRPNVDAAVLPRTLQAALSSGQFAHVPVLIGTNEDEYSLFVAQDQLLEKLPPVTAQDYVPYIESSLGVTGQAAAAIAGQYPLSAYASPQLALTAVGTDGEFACNAQAADDALSRYSPVYGYQFSDQDAPQRYLPSDGFPYGASHTSELSYLFNLSAPLPGPLTSAQQRLAVQMRQYWTSFVSGARPLSADGLTPPASTIQAYFAAQHHCGFWNSAG